MAADNEPPQPSILEQLKARKFDQYGWLPYAPILQHVQEIEDSRTPELDPETSEAFDQLFANFELEDNSSILACSLSNEPSPESLPGVESPEEDAGAPPSIDWIVISYADATGDGNSDVVWLNQLTGLIALWIRDAGGNVTGTAVVGNQPTGWSLITSADIDGNPGLELFFRTNTSGEVVYWTLDTSGNPVNSTSVGVPAAGWFLVGVGSFDNSAGLLFQNFTTGQLAYWNIDAGGNVTGTGSLGEAPSGCFVFGVGRL